MEGALQSLKARDIFTMQMDLMGFTKKKRSLIQKNKRKRRKMMKLLLFSGVFVL